MLFYCCFDCRFGIGVCGFDFEWFMLLDFEFGFWDAGISGV